MYTDSHFSISSSILSSANGTFNYSARLDYLIKSFKWQYEVFRAAGVREIYNAGDLLDSDLVRARESAALAEALSYNKDIPEIHIIGNHEKEDISGKYTSISILNSIDNITVIDEPTKFSDKISLIPYTEDLAYMDLEPLRNKILISHINYAGMRLGNYVLEHGLDMGYACNYFDFIFNGHIHTAGLYNNKVMNVGAMFGTSFNDNYSYAYPGILVIDTDNLQITRYNNPESILFYDKEFDTISGFQKFLINLKNSEQGNNPLCIKIGVPYHMRDDAREILEKSNLTILASRVSTLVPEGSSKQVTLEKVEIEKFNSGADAFLKYIEQESDDKFPRSRQEISNFINSYLR